MAVKGVMIHAVQSQKKWFNVLQSSKKSTFAKVQWNKMQKNVLPCDFRIRLFRNNGLPPKE